MSNIANGGRGNVHVSPNGKIIQNIFSNCDSCKAPIENEDLVQIADLYIDRPFDQIIAFECYSCTKMSAGKPGSLTGIQEVIDEQINAFENGAPPKDWRDL